MIVRRAGQWLGYSVTVAPLSVEVTYLDRPMVMLVVTDPRERSHLKTDQRKAEVQVGDSSTFMEWKSRQPDAENANGGIRYYFHVSNGSNGSTFADENGGSLRLRRLRRPKSRPGRPQSARSSASS
jgi:hypothetical protein